MYTKDPEPTYQTMFADIAVQKGREQGAGSRERGAESRSSFSPLPAPRSSPPYTLALYFVDWDSQRRSVGVEIIDPVSLKQLAAVQVVRNYHDGVYLMYRCGGSVRVRIDTITKPNATLSGLFFSP